MSLSGDSAVGPTDILFPLNEAMMRAAGADLSHRLLGMAGRTD
jgi:hypothetical protein